MSKIIVPLHLADLTVTPASVASGFKKFYLKDGELKLYNNIIEKDVVLDRTLDGFTPLPGVITSNDSVLTALEKLYATVSGGSGTTPNIQQVLDISPRYYQRIDANLARVIDFFDTDGFSVATQNQVNSETSDFQIVSNGLSYLLTDSVGTSQNSFYLGHSGLFYSLIGNNGNVGFQIPIRTSGGSGLANFSIQSNKAVGNYLLATLDDIAAYVPTLQQVLDNNHDLINGNNFQGTGAGGGSGFKSSIIAFGTDAANSNLILGSSNFFGTNSGKDSQCGDTNAMGEQAAQEYIGGSSNAFGFLSLFQATGQALNAFGTNALAYSSGNNVNAMGDSVGLFNTFNSVNLFGYQAIADDDYQTVFSRYDASINTLYSARLSYKNITADRKYELQDASGTLAFLSDITGGATNLGYTASPTNGIVTSDTGTDATLTLADGTDAGLMTPANFTKLAGIATGANVGVVPNGAITGATKTKITYDSKGLVTSGSDATTADIADSTNKRYQTDAQQTNNDATSSIQTQLDRIETFIYSKSNQVLGSHTGNAAETVLLSVNINAAYYVPGDFLTFLVETKKSGVGGTATYRVRAGTAGTTADAQIALLTANPISTVDLSSERRRMSFLTGNLLQGIAATQALATDVTSTSNAVTQTSLNPANAWKLTITVTNSNSGDTTSLTGLRIGKIKLI